jgi:hypothetical protein
MALFEEGLLRLTSPVQMVKILHQSPAILHRNVRHRENPLAHPTDKKYRAKLPHDAATLQLPSNPNIEMEKSPNVPQSPNPLSKWTHLHHPPPSPNSIPKWRMVPTAV